MATKPTEWKMPEGDYAGDVTAQTAWDALAVNQNMVLVDVRTETEWNLIGKPDLSSINHEPIYLQWVTLQGVNKNFVDELQAALEERGVEKGTSIYIMCQSGGRSKIAAMQCTERGYTARVRSTNTNTATASAAGKSQDYPGRSRRSGILPRSARCWVFIAAGCRSYGRLPN